MTEGEHGFGDTLVLCVHTRLGLNIALRDAGTKSLKANTLRMSEGEWEKVGGNRIVTGRTISITRSILTLVYN